MNYKTIKAIALAVFVLVSISSCEEDALVDVGDARVVVEGFLHAGEPASVKLTKEFLFKGTEGEEDKILDNLEVTLSSGNQIIALTHKEDGRYMNTDLIIDPSEQYTLNFVYNGKNISATTTIPDKPSGFFASDDSILVEQFSGGGPIGNSDLETIELTWENPGGDYFLVVVTALADEPEPIITIDIELPSFRSGPLISDHYDLQSNEFQYYGEHSIVLYRLNSEYAVLYEDSGESSLDISTPYTNIENGLGILTGVNSDTLYINVHN